jgi:hypothetical protein
VQYKTAFVLAHKLREAMAAEHKGKVLRGHVEIDGAYFGGHVKPANRKADRVDRRLAEHQTGKRRCVVALRERGGRTLPFVVITEDQAVPLVRRVVEHGSTIYADEAAAGQKPEPAGTLFRWNAGAVSELELPWRLDPGQCLADLRGARQSLSDVVHGSQA